VAGFRSREQAEAALTEALAGSGGGDRRTVAGFVEMVWLPSKHEEVDRTTFDQYTWAVRRHIVPALGQSQLAELDAKLLDSWLRRLRCSGRGGGAPLSAASVRLIRKVLSMACQEAVDRGLLADNPVRATTIPAAAPSSRVSWSEEQARRFLAVADGHRLGLAFHLAMVAELRRGEVLGLRWSDLDVDGGRLRVEQQLMVEGGRARLKLVPERDRRHVALPPWLVGMLVEHHRHALTERAGDGQRVAGDLMFRAPAGGWLTPERFTRVLDELIEQSHVPRITPNDLRRVPHPGGR
jgi:integrase